MRLLNGCVIPSFIAAGWLAWAGSASADALSVTAADQYADSTVVVAASDTVIFTNGITTFAFGGLAGGGVIALTNLDGSCVTLEVGGLGADTAFSGTLSDCGGLAKAGTGTLTLANTNTYAGATVISEGALAVDSTIGTNGFEETIFNNSAGDAQNDIESFRARARAPGADDGLGILTNRLHYQDDNAVSARAAELGASGFDNGDFAMLWIADFAPTEPGAWGFRFDNVDDNASLWIDTDGNGTFESGNRFYARGCCGGSGDQYTPQLLAGATYKLGIVMNDTGGGGYLQNLQFKAPSGAWTSVNPSDPQQNGLWMTGGGRLTNVLPAGTALAIAGGAVLELNGGSQQVASLSGNGTLDFGVGGVLSAGDANDCAFAGVIAGEGMFVKTGGGRLTLSGPSTWSGALTVSNGTLQVSAAGALGSSDMKVYLPGGGTLELAFQGKRVVRRLVVNGINLRGGVYGADSGIGALTGPGFLEVPWINIRDGSWSASASWENGIAPVAGGRADYFIQYIGGSYAGGDSVNDLGEGFLLNQLSFGAGQPAVGLSGQSLAFQQAGSSLPQVNQNAAATLRIRNNLLLSANTTFGGAGDTIVSGAISGPGGLAKTGSGRLTLSGTNTYSGPTVVSAGRLKLQPPLPSVSTAPGLWLDATTLSLDSGASVGTWYDSSGNNRNASGGSSPTYIAANPAFNNLPTVRFNGSSQYLTVDLGFLKGSAYTIFAVTAKRASVDRSYFLGNNTESWGPNNTILQCGWGGDTSLSLRQYGNDLNWDSAPSYSGSETACLYVGKLDTGGGHYIFYNGLMRAGNGNTAPLSSSNSGAVGKVGLRRGSGGSILDKGWFNGDIGEILVYSSALSDADRRTVESYLNAKWGLGIADLPIIGGNILSPNTELHMVSGGMMDLGPTTNAVRALYLDGVRQSAGTWGSSAAHVMHANDIFFAGSGMLLVPFTYDGAALILR